MSAENEVRAIIETWARAVSAADRAAILAHRADAITILVTGRNASSQIGHDSLLS